MQNATRAVRWALRERADRPFLLFAREPSLQGFTLQVGEPVETASLEEAFQVSASVRPVHLDDAPRLQRLKVGVEVLADRRRQVLGDPGFGGGEQPGPHPLGPPLQVGEHLPGGGLVPASGRRLDDDAVAVAVPGEVGARLVADAFGPVPPGRHGGRPDLPLAVPPSGEPHPLADDELGPRR